jgi:serine/threonine protein kinase
MSDTPILLHGGVNISNATKIKLLNQGTFGCVFRPNIGCNSKIGDKNFISKVQREKSVSNRETEISEKIKKIKHYNDYFAPILNTCKISLAKISENEIKKCEFIKKKAPMFANKMRYVGNKTLMEYLDSILEEKPSIKFFSKFFDCYLHLLTAIQLLMKQNIVHNDVKENNILYDDKRDSPILIDYGLSYDINDLSTSHSLKSAFYTYGYDYVYWSFETAMISFITNKAVVNWNENISEDVIQQVIQDFIGENPIFQEIIDKTETKDFEQSLTNYMKSFHGKTYQETIEELLRFAPTYDTYSLAITFLYCIYDLKLHKHIEKFPDISHMIHFYKSIILAMPNKRIDSVEAETQFNSIIYNFDDAAQKKE